MLDDAKYYSSKIITENNLKASKDKVYYTLLPVWMVNVVYKNKKYLFAMNGQTGKFIGDIPIDGKKAVIYSIAIFIIAFIQIILISYLLFKVGD